MKEEEGCRVQLNFWREKDKISGERRKPMAGFEESFKRNIKIK